MNKILFFTAKWVIIPAILVAQFFYIAFLFNPYEPFSIVTYHQTSIDAITSTKSIGKPLYKGDKVFGVFTALDPNLGIVLVRFWNFENISKDKLTFRIKEVGSKNWYYEGTYKVDQFQPNEYFTFGFPIISNSKGKRYQFELESTAGKQGDAIAISTKKPYFATRYKFFLSENKKHPIQIIKFLGEKIIDLITDTRSVLISILYLFPFIVFTSIYLIDSKISIKLFYLGLPIYIFSLSLFKQFVMLPEVTIFTVCVYWMFGIIRYKLDSSVSFAFSIMFFLLTAIVATFDYTSYIAYRFGIFFYWMVLFGTIERVIEIKLNKTYPVNWKRFLHLLIS